MAGEIVTLVPDEGASLVVSSGDYRLGLDVDWGARVVEPALATGTDIYGAVVGTRQLPPIAASLPVHISADTEAGYIAACQALALAASNLALYGGTIKRQVDFGGGTLGEALKAQVYRCDLRPEEGWMSAHRLWSRAVLAVERYPAWEALVEESRASATNDTDAVTRVTLAASRGDLPARARVVVGDDDSTARDFLEVGGAFQQSAQAVVLESGDATAEAGVLTADGDAISSGGVLRVTSSVPVWATVGVWEDLAYSGVYAVRVRARQGAADDDLGFEQRVAWRAGPEGRWRELSEFPELPDAEGFYDLPAGTIRATGDAPTIDVRVDVRPTESTSIDYDLDCVTLTPAEVYAVAGARDIPGLEEAADLFDNWDDEAAGDEIDATTAPAGGDWAKSEHVSKTGANDWEALGGGGARRAGADDDDDAITNGQFQSLDNSSHTDITWTVWGALNHKGALSTETALGAFVRYVDDNNWLMVMARARRAGGGVYRVKAALYKRVTGTLTQIKDKTLLTNKRGLDLVKLTVSAGDGTYTASVSYVNDKGVEFSQTWEGSDSALNTTGGSLDSGDVGIYGLTQSQNEGKAWVEAHQASGYTSAVTFTSEDIVRADGTGVIAYDGAYAADADGTSNRQPVLGEGARIVLPVLAGEITVKVRDNNSDSDIDEGHDRQRDVTVYEIPAFSDLPDTTA